MQNMQSKLKATQTLQVRNNVSPTRFTEHAPTQRHTIGSAGITIFHRIVSTHICIHTCNVATELANCWALFDAEWFGSS